MTVVLELTLVNGPDAGKVHRIVRDGAIIGRSASVDVPIGDASASRQHARLNRRDDDFEIENLSPNHTLVNGKAVTTRKLKDGDIIQIGGETQLRARYLTQTAAVVAHADADARVSGRSAFDEGDDSAPLHLPATRKPSLLRKPQVIIGLSLYFVALLTLWLMLATRAPTVASPRGLGRDDIRALLEAYFAPDSAAFAPQPDPKREREALQRAREAFNTARVSGQSLWAAAHGFRETQSHHPDRGWRDPEDARRFGDAKEQLAKRLADLYVRALAEQQRGRPKPARDLFNKVREIVPDAACGVNQNVSQWIAAINRQMDGG